LEQVDDQKVVDYNYRNRIDAPLGGTESVHHHHFHVPDTVSENLSDH
jgi:hypothetical protein